MTVAEGHFQLYSHLTPPLPAGDYRFTTGQDLSATGPHGALDPTALPVEKLVTHVRVTSPRYQLPPDQVLSTYPPANTEGAYGARLPQVVIKRRTLPWERTVDPEGESTVDDVNTPWLALVVIAEGEADLVLNRPVAECVTPGQVLAGTPDVAQGNYLAVHRSTIDRILPTQRDVPLLAHAREVDIHDTEMMMGDDDGFLAVVIANRLPLPGRDADGNEVPAKYLCALINLEGQFGVLRKETPPPVLVADWPVLVATTVVLSPSEADQVQMGGVEGTEIWNSHVERAQGLSEGVRAERAFGQGASAVSGAAVAKENQVVAAQLREGWATGTAAASDSVYVEMARDFGRLGVRDTLTADPVYRFPVLLHWSFTSTGDTTFRSLMEHLDSGLMGTLPPEPTTPPDPLRGPVRTAGLQPLEVVETGHVGIDQRTRRGDSVRAWYRGPLLPHPADTAAPRLPLAHAADQLRAIVPDRREDLSLAAAFEIGRLLALSQPSMVAALLRWRQTRYQAARTGAVWGGILEGLDLRGTVVRPDRHLGISLGRGLARAVAGSREEVLGNPVPLVTAGTAMGLTDGDAVLGRALATGLGIDAELDGPMVDLLGAIREAPIPQVSLADLPTGDRTRLTGGALRLDLATRTGLLALDALGLPSQLNPVLGAGALGRLTDPGAVPSRAAPDALDEAIDTAGVNQADEEEE
jgi:hypothetical protein